MTTLKHNIYCSLSGLQLGCLEYVAVAGHAPWIKEWSMMQTVHPVFSFSTSKRLAFARAEWKRLSKLSAAGKTTEDEDNILRVAFLAVLHSLDSVEQMVPSLPPIHIVQDEMKNLFSIAYWHNFLDSKRFSFPLYRITKANNNADFSEIGSYIEVCYARKKAYESAADDAVEEAKLAAAERAMKALRNAWVQPVTNAQLWRWVKAHLPKRYEADAAGWMHTIFTGNEKAIMQFEKSELELMEEIIIAECPRGTAVMAACRARFAEIMKTYTDNKEAFTVDFADFEDSEPLKALRAASKAPDSVTQPKREDYSSVAEFIRAKAFYYLQQRARETKDDPKTVPVSKPKPADDDYDEPGLF
jgi:hypothetical protein